MTWLKWIFMPKDTNPLLSLVMIIDNTNKRHAIDNASTTFRWSEAIFPPQGNKTAGNS